MDREQIKEAADRSWGQDKPAEAKAASSNAQSWPDERTEKTMLEDASLLESEFAPTSTGHDAACHIKALLERVRYLEAELVKDAAVIGMLLHEGRQSADHLRECASIFRGGLGLPRVSALAFAQAERLRNVISKAERGGV